jgi:glycerol-3-phosphate acyltransferase PlsY
MEFAAVVVLGYVLGSCPWGYWIVRVVKGEDIRRTGSGNIGATNVWRTYGRSFGIPVILLDVAKGFVPAVLGAHLVSPLCGVVAGAAAMAGHWRPLFLGFQRGGKMVATAGGVLWGLTPLVAATCLVIWVLVFLLSRYSSLASLVATAAVPVFVYLYGYPTEILVFSIVAAAAVIVLHRANLRRLRDGTENRFEFRRTARA